MPASDYLTDPDYLALLRRWWIQGEPDFCFADWLRDRGLEGQADCVGWSLLRPILPVEYGKDQVWGRCVPKRTYRGYKWYFHTQSTDPSFADEIISTLHAYVGKSSDVDKFGCCTSVELALTALLDGYADWTAPKDPKLTITLRETLK